MSEETVLKICILNGPDYIAKSLLAFFIVFTIYTHMQQTGKCHVKDLNNN